MSSPEQDRSPTGEIDLRSAGQANDAQQAAVKRAWTPPTMTAFKVTETQGGAFNFPFDGSNNTSSIP